MPPASSAHQGPALREATASSWRGRVVCPLACLVAVDLDGGVTNPEALRKQCGCRAEQRAALALVCTADVCRERNEAAGDGPDVQVVHTRRMRQCQERVPH